MVYPMTQVRRKLIFDSENSYGIDDFPEINVQITHINGDRYLLKSVTTRIS